MNILILGGTDEARTLARSLHQGPHAPYYSSAREEADPPPCPRRDGPFPSLDALSDLLQRQQIQLLVDATDPYARTISLQAFEAAARAGVSLWGYQRPPWRQQPGDRWVQTPDWRATLEMSGFTRPLIALEGELNEALAEIPAGQQWFVSAPAGKVTEGEGYRVIEHTRGCSPEEALEQLLDLAQREAIDAVVTRDHGGPTFSPEVLLARARDLPVIFQARPALPEPQRLFNDINTLLMALNDEH